MTPSQRLKLKSIFPNASQSFLNANNHSSNGIGAYPLLQKQETDIRLEADKGGAVVRHSNPRNRTKGSKGHAADHPKYRVTIIWNVSDRRIRDNDGMLATIMDCLVRSARRLAGMDTRKLPKREVRRKG